MWGWEAKPLPVVTTASVSPSVTLRLYLEESGLPGSSCHGNMLTKSSFRGGWLTQKLRG